MPGSEKGWIQEFHEALKERVDRYLGRSITVWQDERLRGIDVLDETISNALRTTTVLVSVLSPRYLESESCLRELREFLIAAEHNGGLRISSRSRVFTRVLKVVKTFVPLIQHPTELQEVTGHEFYEWDTQAERPREFIFDKGHKCYWQFHEKLDDVAYEIRDAIEVIEQRIANPFSNDSDSQKKTVYLAETTSDLNETRDRINRELRQRGHPVLPNKPLPLNTSELITSVGEDLRRSQLSIHLIGSIYGVVPEGVEHSVARLQIELAGTHSNKDNPFQRIVWRPLGLVTADQRQERFLSWLQTEVAGQPGIESPQTTVEELKALILDKLKPALKKNQWSVSANGRRRIYLMCKVQDVSEARQVAEYLYQNGHEVVLPVMEADEAQSGEDHKENLLWCDAAMIYYGMGNEPWFLAKYRDLDKAFGYGRQKNWLAKAFYIAPPKTEPPQNLFSHDAVVIHAHESFRPELLDPFVTQLREH
jgi:hypothetical protein